MSSFTWFLIRLWVNIRTEGYSLSWSKKNVTFSSGKSFSLAYSSCPCYIQTKTNVCSSPSLPLPLLYKSLSIFYSTESASLTCPVHADSTPPSNPSRLGIFIGFAAFFVMEKTLRVLGGGEEGGHSHSHSHSHAEPESGSADSGHASGVHVSPSANGLKSRKGDDGEKTSAGDEASSEGTEEHHSEVKGPSKLSAYLNLFGDFVHNMCVLLFSTFFCFFLAARSDRMV